MENPGADRFYERQDLERVLQERRAWFQRGSVWWSFAHHLSAFGATFASVAVGFIVQQPDKWQLVLPRDALSTVLAFTAAILAAAAATGGFERKWRSNRLSRSAVDLMLIDMMAGDADVVEIRRRLRDTISRHDGAIVGAVTEQQPRTTEPSKVAPPPAPADAPKALSDTATGSVVASSAQKDDAEPGEVDPSKLRK